MLSSHTYIQVRADIFTAAIYLVSVLMISLLLACSITLWDQYLRALHSAKAQHIAGHEELHIIPERPRRIEQQWQYMDRSGEETRYTPGAHPPSKTSAAPYAAAPNRYRASYGDYDRHSFDNRKWVRREREQAEYIAKRRAEELQYGAVSSDEDDGHQSDWSTGPLDRRAK